MGRRLLLLALPIARTLAEEMEEEFGVTEVYHPVPAAPLVPFPASREGANELVARGPRCEIPEIGAVPPTLVLFGGWLYVLPLLPLLPVLYVPALLPACGRGGWEWSNRVESTPVLAEAEEVEITNISPSRMPSSYKVRSSE